jgi:hypothetical protein
MRLTLLLALLIPCLTYATDYKKKPPTQTQHQSQGQHQKATSHATAESAVTNDVAIGNDSAAEVNISSESGPADILMVPQGHTANCLRTYGVSYGDKSGGGGIGWPYRDKDCDYANNAADAFAAGQHAIGWYWNCHKKASYKPFKRSGSTTVEAVQACHAQMMRMYVNIAIEKPDDRAQSDQQESQITVNCGDSDHDEKHDRIFKKCVSK